MSFRYFPHMVLLVGVFFFLMKGVMILIEGRVRIPFTFRRYVEGARAKAIAILFFILSIICAWDFIWILINSPSN